MGRRKLITKKDQDRLIKAFYSGFNKSNKNTANDDSLIIPQKPNIGCFSFIIFITSLIVFSNVFKEELESEFTNKDLLNCCFFFISLAISLYFYKYYNKKFQELLDAKHEELNSLINSHISVLTTKYNQLVYKDDYGLLIKDKYLKELDYFVSKVLFPNSKFSQEAKNQLFICILNIVEANITEPISRANTSPYDFEFKCAETLNQLGWQAHATQASGDQGVDVVAEKDGKKVVIQCKLYSKPVGNKAVQEIYSGKDYYNADYAVVVSNQAYTASARQLAHKCGVVLLSFEDLLELDTFLK